MFLLTDTTEKLKHSLLKSLPVLAIAIWSLISDGNKICNSSSNFLFKILT